MYYVLIIKTNELKKFETENTRNEFCKDMNPDDFMTFEMPF